SKTPFMLGPQTYGPYKNKILRHWAKTVIKRSDFTYTRDGMSGDYVYNLWNYQMKQVTDVAFALPYDKSSEEEFSETPSKIRIGINISGLLWQGGYTKNNQFGLKTDYKCYCRKIIEYLYHNDKYQIFLIPHVGYAGKKTEENDYIPCFELIKEYPNITLIDRTETASDIKSEIAKMHIFIGARMHATIGAFSSGVATIPFSYSRKFEGLYHSLNYPYVIEAIEYGTEENVKKTKEYIDNYKELKKNVEKSMEKVREYQEEFRGDLARLLSNRG
ncbi:polysaccharide pyruvyl transferase family protein, partial [Lachnospiraceae bacterium OttesenSCG-928-D06]|nr:polysaccharide pyruvyl transferase family protein [Lachnospiraceae bacterium OttesenSCG-928-D06]